MASMKWFKQLRMKRRQHRAVSEDESIRRSFFSSKKRSDTGLTCEESGSLDSTEEAPWRVENILENGAPKETDWWDQESSVDDEDDQSVGSARDSGSAPTESSTHEKGVRFRNCGFETWAQVQEAWRSSGTGTVKESMATARPSPILKQEFVKSLSGRRKFDLPQRIPLKNLIGAYNDIWNGDSD